MDINWIVANVVPYLLILVVFYVVFFIPQRKKDKKVKEMISTVKVGDKITTIGGISGKIVKIKDDTIIIETGLPTQPSNVKFKKWAIKEVETQEE